jgi:hypothetical protein
MQKLMDSATNVLEELISALHVVLSLLDEEMTAKKTDYPQ